MTDGLFEISDKIETDVYAALERGLIANAIEKNAPPYKETELSIVRRSDAGEIVAGLTGKTFWNWLYVDLLWVDKSLRGQGAGSAMMRAAEEEAIKRGCIASYVWTQSFEGAGFYPKLGYKEFVVKHDFPIGHQRTGFMKHLAA